MHVPVLIKEVLEYLAPKPNENFIDGTAGQGGHIVAILEKNKPDGKVLGIDADSQQIENCKNRLADFKERFVAVNDSYANLKEIVARNNFSPINGVLLDLGMSTWHLQESGRGFSFLKDEPLDMSYGGNGLTAEEIVNKWPEEEIEKILREYGEERFARRISQKIVEARDRAEIKSTFQLLEIIKTAFPARYLRGKIHYATRTFQALRIAANGELDNLKSVLPQILEVLENNGRIAIISFHSLEDRIVKNFFRDQQKQGIIKILTKKPVVASEEEIKNNPASRSAKLRAAILCK